jgi:hypothetical protein
MKPLFTKDGAIRTKRGRPSLALEIDSVDIFRRKLEAGNSKALDNIIKSLYDIAIDKNENVVARVRASEIILAYAIGRPAVVEHQGNNHVQITFTRAEPIKPKRLEIE